MRKMWQSILFGIIAVSLTLGILDHASAQHPVTVVAAQPVVSTVVGYAPARRGLFGRRIVYRPIVAPAAPLAPVVAPQVVARPVTPLAPVVVRYAPAPAIPKVSAFYTPMQPVPVRVLHSPPVTYRIPLTTYVPVIGY